jgi:hypothetical protein
VKRRAFITLLGGAATELGNSAQGRLRLMAPLAGLDTIIGNSG